MVAVQGLYKLWDFLIYDDNLTLSELNDTCITDSDEENIDLEILKKSILEMFPSFEKMDEQIKKFSKQFYEIASETALDFEDYDWDFEEMEAEESARIIHI